MNCNLLELYTLETPLAKQKKTPPFFTRIDQHATPGIRLQSFNCKDCLGKSQDEIPLFKGGFGNAKVALFCREFCSN